MGDRYLDAGDSRARRAAECGRHQRLQLLHGRYLDRRARSAAEQDQFESRSCDDQIDIHAGGVGQREARPTYPEIIRHGRAAVAQSRGRERLGQRPQTGAPALHLHRDVEVLRSAGRGAQRDRVRAADEPAEAVTVEHPGDRGERVSERPTWAASGHPLGVPCSPRTATPGLSPKASAIV